VSTENINKHGINLSDFIAGNSVVKFYDDEEKAFYTRTYLSSGEEGWLTIRFGNRDWYIHPDDILNISKPESKWE